MTTDNARAVREAAISLYRAMRRANPDAWAEVDEVEDWAYWEDIVRTAQLTSAEGRAETTTATPPGLTVSEDGSVLNWQGVNYVPQRAETTTGAIARQIARETAMTGRDALELVEAVQALQDAETTTATDEDAVSELLERMSDAVTRLETLRAEQWEASERQRLHGKIEGVKLAASYVEEARGLLATTRTRPTREELSTLILSFLKPPKHSGGSWTLNPDDAADAVLELFRGGDK